MRVMIFIWSLSGGGAERVAAHLANDWASRGREVLLVTFTADVDHAYALDSRVRVRGLGFDQPSPSPVVGAIRNIKRAWSLRKVIKEFRPDVAVAFMPSANVLLALASLGLPVWTIGCERNSPAHWPDRGPWIPARRFLYGLLDAVVAQTIGAAAWLEQRTTTRSASAIPNPVIWPLPVLQPVWDPKAHIGEGRKIIMGVGRLAPEKNWPLLIEAFRRLADDEPDWDLVVLGEGPDREALWQRVEAAGLQSRVSFPGRAGNVGEWYGRADIFALTSHFEGFPNVLIEAMAHGLPAVAVDCREGPRDIILEGRDGFLTPPGDVETLVDRLSALMRDSDLRHSMGERATDVRRRFSQAQVLDMWESVLHARSRPRRGAQATAYDAR